MRRLVPLVLLLGALTAAAPSASVPPAAAAPHHGVARSAAEPLAATRLERLNAPCQDVVWVGARGSGEPSEAEEGGAATLGMGTPVSAAFAGYRARVSDRRVAYWPVDYPAEAISGDLVTAAGRRAYFKGLDVGITDILLVIASRRRLCPQERYVFAGYSQGAMVVHRTLFQIADRKLLPERRILGFVLIADGDQLKDQRGLNLGTAGNGSGRSEGISWINPKAAGETYKPVARRIPTAYRDRTISVCDENDIVCDPENLELPLPWKRVKIHTSHYHVADDPNEAYRAGRILGGRTMNLTAPTPGLQLVSSDPAPITAGSPYEWQFTAGGGVAPYTFEYASYTYFNGYSLGTDGLFSGQNDFDFDGSIEFTLRITDARGQRITQAVTISVLEAVEPTPEPEPGADQLPGPELWSDISVDDATTCGIKPDGSAWCWGDLDDATSALPSPVLEGHTWSAIEVGGGSGTGTTVCAIRADDTLWCWGWIVNDWNSGTQTSAADPRQLPGSWTQVSVGDEHACGVRTDGSAWCWGDNIDGQLGAGIPDLYDARSPVLVSGGGTWQDVSAGGSHTCGTQSDGSGWCWGGNGAGQLGTPAAGEGSDTPVEVVESARWTSLVAAGAGYAGSTYTCGTREDRTAWCWGQTSPLTTDGGWVTGSETPLQVAGDGQWASVSAGTNHRCLLDTEGAAWCWGSNYGAQLGNGKQASYGTFGRVAGDGVWRTIEVGDTAGSSASYTCGIRTDGTAWCWGDRLEGQLGNGTTENVPAPTRVSGGATWASVSVGVYHGCGIRVDRSGWCWGGGYGESLRGSSTQAETSLVPTQIPGGHEWQELSAGAGYSCGVGDAGRLWCWGDNDHQDSGRLGNGTATSTYDLSEVVEPGPWRSVSAGVGHTCGIKEDATAWCWGQNDVGELGSGTDDPYVTRPVEVDGGNLWSAVVTDWRRTCGIQAGGSLWCWGDVGVLGGAPSSRVPQQVGTATSWTGLSSSGEAVCATNSAGELWCWEDGAGAREEGTWTSADVGASKCGIQPDQTVSCWGLNDSGQLGGGTTDPWPEERSVTLWGQWRAVDVQAGTVCAVHSDASLWCWGFRGEGLLGNGTAWYVTRPTPVLG